MKINDSSNINSTLASVQHVGKANKQAVVKPVSSAVDENSQANKKLDKDKSRFDVSEKAIALLEEKSALETALSGSVLVAKDSEGAASNNQTQNNQQSKNAQYDQPSPQNLSAVAAYESVDSIAQKENIKQFFGVNLFA